MRNNNRSNMFLAITIFSILVSVVVVILGYDIYHHMEKTKNTTAEGNYIYPLTPEDSDWDNLSIQEKRDVCRIPQSILKNMTDKQVIQAIWDYPFVHDIYLYSNIETGIKSLAENSDTYIELLRRDSGIDSLKKCAQENAKTCTEFENNVLQTLIDAEKELHYE